jgi:hypothetical protein
MKFYLNLWLCPFKNTLKMVFPIMAPTASNLGFKILILHYIRKLSCKLELIFLTVIIEKKIFKDFFHM